MIKSSGISPDSILYMIVFVIFVINSSMLSPVLADASMNKHSRLDLFNFINTIFLSKFSSLCHFHHSVLFLVLFIAYHHEGCLLSWVKSSLIEPLLQVIEWVKTGKSLL